MKNDSVIQENGILENGIFQNFKIKRPITDIYYGVISEHIMPAYTERYLFI